VRVDTVCCVILLCLRFGVLFVSPQLEERKPRQEAKAFAFVDAPACLAQDNCDEMLVIGPDDSAMRTRC